MSSAVVLVAVALAVAGCGGGKGGNGGTTTRALAGKPVAGPGFVFRTPSEWATTVAARSATAKVDNATLVSVTVLPLAKPYRPKLFPKVVPELNRVAAKLATLLKGKVTARRTVTIVGGRVRQYDIAHGRLVDRLTFVLRGRTNYQLACRWRAAAGEPPACDQLLRTFRLR